MSFGTRRPWLTIAVILGITAFFALQLPKTTLDNDVMNFIPEEHPASQAYQRTSDLFGGNLVLGIGIEFKRADIFNSKNIDLIRGLTQQIEELPNAEDVMSLTNTDFIEGTAEGMKASPLIGEDFEGTEEELRTLKSKLLSWDIYDKTLYSKDFSATQILVTFPDGLDDEQRQELYFQIEDIMQSVEDVPLEYHIAGNPAMTVLLSTNMRSDLVTLIPMVIVVVLLTLYLAFRRLGGVLLPTLTVIVSSIWTVGAMAMLSVPLSIVATVIPVLLVAVGSAYGIHIVSHYFDEVDRCSEDVGKDRRREIVEETMRRVRRPVLMAGLTTIAGFGALATSQVVPMRNFGIFTAVGVLAAVIVAVTFIPSILLVRKDRTRKCEDGEDGGKEGYHPVLMSLYHFFDKGRVRILILAVLVGVVSLYGMSLVVKDNAIIEYFKEDSNVRQADRFLRTKFSGTEFFDVVIRGEKPGDLTNPEILKAMDDMSSYLVEEYEEVTRVNSFADFIKRMNQVMNYPPDIEESAQETAASSGGAKEQEGTGFSSFVSDDSGFNSGFSSEGFSEGQSRPSESDQSDRTENQQSRSAGGISEHQRYLSPVDFDKQFTYGDFARLANRAYAGTDNVEMTGRRLIELINKEMNYRGAAYYEIPYDPAKYPPENRQGLSNLISQYLLLYSGSMDEWADDALEPEQVKMTVQLNTTGSRESKPIVEAVHNYADRYFPDGYTVETTGSALVKYALTNLLVDAQTRSILISLSLVFIIVAFTFRSVAAGIFAIIPLGFAVIINFAVMGFAGIKLDISTAMVASLAIGIGIDYAIHFMSTYHYERLRTDDLETVTVRTLGTTGKAITFNAVSVAAGFAVLIFSKFNPLMYLGVLIAITMFTSSLASMTLLPVLLELFKPKFISRPIRQKPKEVV
ncbi:MAG: MMPL family transporter [Spirochaetales bacterium]|nr:MMPL family transporter [Spirochaetales bacterium]MCF7938799.1 MMPL family transporter [Spirochaetales bacterium]